MRDSSYPHIRRLLAGFGIFLLTAITPACGSDPVTAPPVTSVAGTWNLTSVNGGTLPFVVRTADPKVELLAKQYVFSAAGTFAYSFSVRATDDDGTITLTRGTDTGTQTLADNVVTLRNTSDGFTLTATVSGGTMTIVAGEFSQAFTKQ